MRVITSFNQRLYDEYAWRLIETFKNFPGELIVYSEDRLKLPYEVRNLHQLCPKLLSFKEKFADYKPRDWRFDVCKFANKVFASVHGAWDCTGTVFWLDADVVVHKPIPAEFLEQLIPQNAYCGHFYRSAAHAPYTETGFLMFRGSHPRHQAFLDAWRDQYLKHYIFKSQTGWHDCIAFDEARKPFKGFINLTPKDRMESMHPIVEVLGEYIDHCKGSRKSEGYSVENPHKWWKQGLVQRSAVLGDGE